MDAGLDAADAELGSDADVAIDHGRMVADLGEAATGACELLRAGAGWQAWLGLGLTALGEVAGRFTPSESAAAALGAADAPGAPVTTPPLELPPELVEARDALLEAQGAE